MYSASPVHTPLPLPLWCALSSCRHTPTHASPALPSHGRGAWAANAQGANPYSALLCMAPLGPPFPNMDLTPFRGQGTPRYLSRFPLSCHEGLCVWDTGPGGSAYENATRRSLCVGRGEGGCQAMGTHHRHTHNAPHTRTHLRRATTMCLTDVGGRAACEARRASAIPCQPCAATGLSS